MNHYQLGLLHLKQDGLKYFFKLEIENIRLCSVLSTIVVPQWELFYEKRCLSRIKEQDLCDLIGWAAHEKMYDLLTKKCKS